MAFKCNTQRVPVCPDEIILLGASEGLTGPRFDSDYSGGEGVSIDLLLFQYPGASLTSTSNLCELEYSVLLIDL